MNKNIDCRIIQDLLPAYVDGLTNDYTNQVIEEHMKQCESCKQMLARMQEPEQHMNSAEKEVDYMKKVRIQMSRMLTTVLISTVFLIVSIVACVLIYNRVTPKNYYDIFGGNNVNEFVVHHPESGSEFSLESWEVQEFQGLLEETDYYYEGKEGKLIEGDLFMISVGNSYGPMYELKLTEKCKLYYDEKVYDFRACKELWDFLNNKLQAEQTWKQWEKEQYEYLSGIYVMETGTVTLELNMDTKYFSLLPNMFSSFWESGNFTIDDYTITLELESGPDYIFTIAEEDVLSYVAEKPGQISIPDGAKFIKK